MLRMNIHEGSDTIAACLIEIVVIKRIMMNCYLIILQSSPSTPVELSAGALVAYSATSLFY